ncbi:MAG: gamma-glutamyl-gamma-aminobutyrate hydrolase family protein, partial [Actinobacteria bacterium]|nr:gamma-glutamyl-gamma-aminobutyrate hydrolase family protein [Actinomycetota bacterium]
MTGEILVVDNHDSFVHTLIDYLRELGSSVSIIEADEIPDGGAGDLISAYDGVLVSPGPGTPQRAGASIAVVRSAAGRGIPLLGVCLGHQAIAEAFGATVAHAPELMHGMTSEVT